MRDAVPSDFGAAANRRVGCVLFVTMALLIVLNPADAYCDGHVDRPIDWCVAVGKGELGIAEEHEMIRRRVNADGPVSFETTVTTVICYGIGRIAVPCRLPLFLTATTGLLLGVVALTVQPTLRRWWTTKSV